MGETNCWNVDLLCQKWQLRNKEVGMILSFSPSQYYYCNEEYIIVLHMMKISEYEDWGIKYRSMSFSHDIPSEEEIINVMKEIYLFHKENPELLIGLMSFPDASLATFILIQYVFVSFVFILLVISYVLFILP